MKKCSHCGEVKPYSEFGRNRATSTGYAWRCRICQREAVNQSYRRHKDKILAHKKEYKDLRRDEIRERDKEYYHDNKEFIAARKLGWYERSAHVWKAGKAVQSAILGGRLLSAREYLCASCHAPASEYHHPSYLPDDRLNVIPLCRSCHRLLHARQEQPVWGAVALRVGMVRIVIAGG